MQKFLGLFLASILLFSCSDKEKHTISLNLEPGEVYHQNMKSKMNINQTVMGQVMNIAMDITAKVSFDVQSSQASPLRFFNSLSKLIDVDFKLDYY